MLCAENGNVHGQGPKEACAGGRVQAVDSDQSRVDFCTPCCGTATRAAAMTPRIRWA